MANKEFIARNGLIVGSNVFVVNASTNTVSAVGTINASAIQVNGTTIPSGATSNLVYTTVNTAFDVANAAFGSANNVAPQVAPSFNTANAAFGVANSSYTFANGVATNAAAAFAAANNVAPQVTPSFNTANASYTVANAAFGHSNLTYNATNSAFGVINAAFGVANAAYGNANNLAVSANAYAGAMANSVNTYTDLTYVKLTAASQTITGNVSIAGNLTLLGGSTTISSNNLSVGDSLIYLAANNYSGTDFLDIGFIANYGNTTGANVHTGLVRDATDKQYYLFSGYDKEPANNTFVPGGNNMVNAVLVADFNTSNLTLGGANAIVWVKSSYDNSNGAFGVTNAAFGHSNTTYGAVNSVFGVINAAFGVANNAYTSTNGTAAFSFANGVSTNTTSAFGVANAAFDKANTLATSTNAYASAVGTSTNNYTSATYSTLTQFGSLFGVANAAFGVANNAGGTAAYGVANAAFGVANAAYGAANNVGPQIAPAYNTANAAFAAANAKVATVAGTSGRITSSGTTGITLDLATAGLGAATYSSGISALTVDAYGRVTSVTGSAGYTTGSGYAALSGATFTGLIIGPNPSTSGVGAGNDAGSMSIRGDTTKSAHVSFHRTGAYAINMGLDTDNVFRLGGWSDGATTYRLQLATPGGTSTLNGILVATTDMRAPIFYDQNNTGYYVNPDSTSNIVKLIMSNRIVLPATNDGRTNGLWHWGDADSNWVTYMAQPTVGTNPAGTTMTGGYWNNDHTIRVRAANWSFENYSDNTLRAHISGTGAYFAGQTRSPIYYDSDNTGYYVDPTGTSQFAGLTVGYGSTSSTINMYDSDESTRYIHNNSTTIGFLGSHGSWRFRMADDGNIVIGTYQDWLSNQIRSNIFYDHSDTGYYLDLNGVSRLSGIQSTGRSGNWNTDFQNTPADSFRYGGDLNSGTNCPTGGGWWVQQNFRHSNSSNYWGVQVAWGWEDKANELYTRNVSGGGYGSWIRYSNSTNGGHILLGTITATNAGAIQDTSILSTSGYSRFIIVIKDTFTITNSTTLYMQFYSGGAFQTASYTAQGTVLTSGGYTAQYLASGLYLSYPSQASNAHPFFARIEILNPSNTTYWKPYFGQGTYYSPANAQSQTYQYGGAWHGGTGAITGFRIYAASGNVTGTVQVFGVV